MPLSTHETKAAAAQQEQQHQHASDVHVTLTDKAITNCLAMSEREKENQHRWLKMQAGQATIYVILETLIIETNREGSHPTSTKRVGRSVGGGQRGLLSASANLTGNAGHLNQQRRITSNVNKACGEKRGVRSEASVRQPPIKPEPVFFLGE